MSAYDQFLQETKSAPSSGGSPKVVPPEVGGGGQPETPAISAYQRFQQETKTAPITPSPTVKTVVKTPEASPVVPENTSTIKKVSNFLSDWLINKPINFLGEKLYETNPQYFQDVATGLDITKAEGGHNAGEEILKTLQQGQRAISGLTGGIITPKTEAPENIVSKIYGGFSEAIGSVVALKGIGTGLGALTDTPKITAYLAQNPLVYKYALPFVQNAVGFSLYGQLDPNLGNNVGERFKKLGIDIATSVPYTLLGGVKSAKVSIPASFALGFGMAKLSGASNEDAFISGTVLGGLDAYSRLGGSGNHFTDGREVEKKLKIESLNILNKYSDTKLTLDSSPEDFKKAFYRGAQQTHPDKTGGADTEFKKVNSAYQFLAPKTEKVPTIEEAKNNPDLKGTLQSFQSSGHDLDRAIEAGDIPVEKVYKNKAGELQPAYVTHVVSDLAGKLDAYKKGLGEAFTKTVDKSNPTPTSLDNQASIFLNKNVTQSEILRLQETLPPPARVVPRETPIPSATPAVDETSVYGKYLKEKGVDLTKPAFEIQKAIEGLSKTPAPQATEPVATPARGNEVIPSATGKTAPSAKIESIPVKLDVLAKNISEANASLESFLQQIKDGLKEKNLTKRETVQNVLKEIKNAGLTPETFYDLAMKDQYPRTITAENVDVKKLSDPAYFVKTYKSTFARGHGTDEKLYKILTKELVPAGREASGFLADKYNEAKKSLTGSVSDRGEKPKIKDFKTFAEYKKAFNEYTKPITDQINVIEAMKKPQLQPLIEYAKKQNTLDDFKKNFSAELERDPKFKKARDYLSKNSEKLGIKGLQTFYEKVKGETKNAPAVVEQKLPKQGTVGASIGKYREESASDGKGGDVILGNYDQIKPIEFPELLSLAKDLSGSEVFIKKYKMANGMFYGKDARIGLNPDLFKAGNLQQLQKTMAHEIGHLIDYLPEGTLARGNVLGRLSVLRDFHKDFYAEAGVTRTDPELKAELWNLSKYWKPIDEATAPKGFLQYRKSSAEVYADFISVMFNNPKLAGEMAPSAYNLFFKTLDAKPEVKSAYFELQDILRNGEKVAEMRKDKTQNMFTTADQVSKDRQHQIELEEEQKKKSLWFLFKFQAVSRFESFREKVKDLEKKGIYVNPDDNPVYFLEESNYLGGRIKAEVDTRFNTIYQELLNNGLSWDDLGEITFYERILKGDRAEVANPEGLQIDFVQELYDGFEGVAPDPENNKKGVFSMKSQLGEEKFAKLQQLAVQYRLQIKELYKQAFEAGLIPKETWNMIEKNDFYVPFKPIKYSGTKTSYRIKNQKGTLHAIENPANTGIEKSISLIRAVEKNKVNKASVDFLAKHYPEELKEANYAFNGKARIALEPLDKNMRLVRYMDAGKMKAFYVDQYIGEALQRTPVGHSNMVIEGLRFMNSGLFRPLFITFNLGFQSFNFVRDMTRFWKNVPDISLLGTMKLYAKSARGAKVRAFGLPKNPSKEDKQAYDLINKLEEDRVLSITYNDLIKGEDVEDKQIDRIMREVGVRQSEPTKLGAIASKFGISKKTPVVKQILDIMGFIEKTGNLIESMPKIAGYYALKDKMAPAEMRSYVRRKVGSPDFLDGGKFKPAMNEIFLFSNAIFQGIRSDYETATDPKTRSGYWWKTTQANIIPKLLMILAVAGVFGDELKKLFGKISEYDKTNYITIPFGEDNNGKAIYIRIPHDETGRIISGIFWKIASAVQDPKKLTDTATYTNILAYAGGQAPSISPAVSSVYNVGTFLSGQNPYDFFRGRNVLTDEQMTAGGTEKLKPFMSYMFDNLGGATFTKLYTNEVVPKTPTLSERVLGLPIVSNVAGRWIKSSNYGETEQLKAITSEIDQKKAREALQNRRTVFDAVDQAQGKSYAEANKIKHDMITSVVGIPNTPEKRSLAQSLSTRFDKLRVRGSADTRVDALITAQSNEAKVALLKEFSTSMSTNDFNDLKKFIIKNRVVSSEAFQQFLRESKK